MALPVRIVLVCGCLAALLGLTTRDGRAQPASALERERAVPGQAIPIGPRPRHDAEAPSEGAAASSRELKDEAPSEDEDDSPAGLLGDFLHGRGGLTAEYIYTGEVFNNMRGGLSTRHATRYRGLFDLSLKGDLDKMGLAPGGTVFVLAENLHGSGITEQFVGDFQWLSNLEAPNFTQVSEYWWERTLVEDRLSVRLGKQDVYTEFALVDPDALFIQSSFGSPPTIPMPTYPEPTLAVLAFFTLSETFSLKAGFWDGDSGAEIWGFSGTGTNFTIAELKAQYRLAQELDGQVHAGLWYHSGTFDDRATGVPRPGSHGLYVGLEQMLFKEPAEEPDSVQGLDMFLQYGWAPEALSEVSNYFGAGLRYRGLLPDRDEDCVGIGVADAIFSDFLPDQSYEAAIELFYRAQLTPYIAVQPDLQYIVNPNGGLPDAFVVGLRFEAVL